MKTSTLFVLFLIILESCNLSENKQSTMPTSPVSSSVSTVAEKGKRSGRDSVSIIKPLVPPPGGVGYQSGSQYVADYYQFTGVYLPEDANGRYLVLEGTPPNGDYATMYTKYCFRRAVNSSDQIIQLNSAHFNLNQIIVAIGGRNDDRSPWQVFWGTGTVSYGMPPNWKDIVTLYARSVLGFFMDEPSGLISADSMQKIASFIHAAGSKLWLEDYDTGLISGILYGTIHNYHIVDFNMLYQGDYVWNNGNTSDWVSGANFFGIDVLGADYSEFQAYLYSGNKFNGIACQPMDGSGALMNDATMYNWLRDHSPYCNNLAFYIANGNTNITDGDMPPRIAGLSNFINDADHAGFLGHQCQVYYYTYVCQTNNVNFTPPSSPSPGAGSSSYYGVWTNNSYYNGPVDPHVTPGATLCWLLQSTVATSQIVNVY